MPRLNSSYNGSNLRIFSFQLIQLGATSVRVHWFYLFGVPLVLTFFDKYPAWVSYFVAVFIGLLMLHDLVRVGVAKLFNLTTNEIILLPTGGLASFSEQPSLKAEVAINAFGILSLALCAIGFGGLSYLLHEPHLSKDHITFLQASGIASLFLAVLNVCPVFPFDGSYVLRSILAPGMGWRRATAMVSRISQFVAFGLIAAAFVYLDVDLVLPALYIFSASTHQVRIAKSEMLLKGKLVQDAMQVHFSTLESGTSLEAAAQEMLHGSQHDFPVVVGDEVIGVLTRTDIARGLARFGPSGYVAGQMKRDFMRILPNADLEDAADILSDATAPPLLVMDGDSLVGLLSREKLNEYVLLLQARWISNRSERSS